MLKLREVIRESLRFLLFDNTCSYCHKRLDREGYICSKCLEKLKKHSKNVKNSYITDLQKALDTLSKIADGLAGKNGSNDK